MPGVKKGDAVVAVTPGLFSTFPKYLESCRMNFAEAYSPNMSRPRRDRVSVIVANVFRQSTDEALSVLARKRKLADQLYSWDIPKSRIRINKKASGRK